LLERIELGIEAPGMDVPVAAPLVAPAAVSDEAPSLGGRVPVSGTGTGTGTKMLGALPPDVSIAVGGGTEEVLIDLVCAQALRDISNGSSCIGASSNPTLGMLYPLSSEWYIDPSTGFMGVGTTSPTARLDVAGAAEIQGGLTVSGGSLSLGSVIPNVFLTPDGPNSGGQLLMRSPGAFLVSTVDIRGDAGNVQGQIILRDHPSILDTSDTVNLTANNGADVGELRLNETDGSPAFGLAADEMTGYDSAGVETFSFNRQTGDAVQLLGSNGFIKAGCFVNGASATVSSQFNNLPGGAPITVTRLIGGVYEVDFGTSVASRQPGATLLWSGTAISIRVIPSGNILTVGCYDGGGVLTEGGFWLTIH
jgi:hypothetical protein